jgi:hypothetical protein
VGFSALKADEQLRAAAFALKRDLGVDAAHIRLAARAVQKDDDVAVAFVSVSDVTIANSAALTCPAAFFEAMQSGEIHWFGAPNGIAVGPSGSAAIELHSASTTVTQSNELPNEIVTLLSARGAPNRVVLHDAQNTPSAETLALWHAATGATFVVANSNALTRSSRIALTAASQTTISKPRSALDRALMVACVASFVCLGIAMLQWFTDRAQLKNVLSSAPVSGTISATNAGDLLARMATVAPELIRTMKSATYGGGAWIVSLITPAASDTTAASATKTSPTLDVNALVNGAATALRNNGFSVQATTQPEPRLRVQAP